MASHGKAVVLVLVLVLVAATVVVPRAEARALVDDGGERPAERMSPLITDLQAVVCKHLGLACAGNGDPHNLQCQKLFWHCGRDYAPCCGSMQCKCIPGCQPSCLQNVVRVSLDGRYSGYDASL
uniref:Uncharacterized protein n=1 Tax=Physcomitrium patens TaxID=3218 RepID=A0A2K1K444_PHYPA|nr:hypothetical protein PHYPA_013030 [Physcomitrium patens]